VEIANKDYHSHLSTYPNAVNGPFKNNYEMKYSTNNNNINDVVNNNMIIDNDGINNCNINSTSSIKDSIINYCDVKNTVVPYVSTRKEKGVRIKTHKDRMKENKSKEILKNPKETGINLNIKSNDPLGSDFSKIDPQKDSVTGLFSGSVRNEPPIGSDDEVNKRGGLELFADLN
jgi:hypothetical protein